MHALPLIPDVKQCVSSNSGRSPARTSFKLGLSIAAKGGDCFFFDVSRRKIGDVRQRLVGARLQPGRLPDEPHETAAFGSVTVACGEPTTPSSRGMASLRRIVSASSEPAAMHQALEGVYERLYAAFEGARFERRGRSDLCAPARGTDPAVQRRLGE